MIPLSIRSLLHPCGALVVAIAASACSKDDGAGGTPAAAAATPRSSADAKSDAGSSRPAGTPGANNEAQPKEGGGPGGRAAPSVVLADNDVQIVGRGVIESGPAISGDLRPIEQVAVRARLEGDLIGVYVREGDRVRRGQLLAQFEASEQESDRVSALADREAAQTELATAEWNAEQTEQLFKAGAVAERDLKAAQQAVAAARARVAAAESRVRSTSSFVNDTRVLAPTSGTIAERMVENGEHVARGAAMFTLVRNDVLELAAAVPARDANEVRTGQRVTFSAASRDFEGRVARVSPTINPANRSITVYIQVPNADGSLKGNSLATGRIISRTVNDALIVPTTAVRQSQGEGRTFVYRIAAGAIENAPIRMGVVDEARGVAQVTEGLAPGDRIVVGNVGVLGSGMKVTIVGGGEQGGIQPTPSRPPAP
jgi:RND family efflux transporter MFP subunit